jgi:hypothetical protein
VIKGKRDISSSLKQTGAVVESGPERLVFRHEKILARKIGALYLFVGGFQE